MQSRWRRLLVAAGAGVAVFALFSAYADVSQLRDRLAGFAWPAFAAALGLALTNYALRFARWSLYLRASAIAVPAGLSLLTFLAGFAFSITPGKLGELIKSLILRATREVPLRQSAPIVVAERVTDLIALLLLGLAGIAAYRTAIAPVAAGGALVATVLALLAWPAAAHNLIRAVSRGPVRRYGPRLVDFYSGLAGLVRPAPLSWSTALAILAWLAECLGFALIVSAFPDTAVAFGLATLIYAATTVAGALSFLPGGLGVTEAGMTALLITTAAGVDNATAVAATLLTRLATLWFAVFLGVVALVLLHKLVPASDNAWTSANSS